MSFFEVETANAFLDLEDDNGEKMGIRLEIQPTSSAKVERIKRNNRSEMTAALRKGKDISVMQEDHNARWLASAIVGWEWSEDAQATTSDGNVVRLPPKEYSEENAIAMMRDENFSYVARQVDEFLGKHSNFYKA